MTPNNSIQEAAKKWAIKNAPTKDEEQIAIDAFIAGASLSLQGEQDKNFTTRLKAAVDKRMHNVGIVIDTDKELALWDSMEDITLDYLQGSNPSNAPQGAGVWVTGSSVRDLIKQVFIAAQQGGGYTKETEDFFFKRFQNGQPVYVTDENAVVQDNNLVSDAEKRYPFKTADECDSNSEEEAHHWNYIAKLERAAFIAGLTIKNSGVWYKQVSVNEPPQEGREVIWIYKDIENAPVYGKYKDAGKFKYVMLQESSGEEEYTDLNDYEFWLYESPSTPTTGE